MTDALTWAPAWRISELIRTKELSPVEVLDHFLGRIEEHQEVLQAFDRIDERARSQAKAAEDAVLSGEVLGPLHGVPIAVKCHLDIAGLPQTPPFGSDIAVHDDLIVERLRGAGAVIVGHTGMPVYASDGSWDYAATARNPWDPSRTPGISSAGTAAAVAAGLVPVALGSDSGGSSRLPAAYSGIVGMHPTPGLVPWLGAIQMSISSIGPMTRDVRDAATVLSVIAGPDGRDLTGLPVEIPDPRSDLDGGAEGLKLAWTDDFGFAMRYASEESARVIRHIKEAAFALTGLGAAVETTDETWEDHAIVMRAFFAQSATDDLARELAAGSGRAGGIQALMRDALALRQRNWLRFRKIFKDFDLLLCPTTHTVAPTVEVFATRVPSAMSVVQGGPGPDGYSVYTSQFNLLRFPAASVPCGFVDGLPVGLQIVGFAGNDAKVLRLAQAFRQAFPQESRPPVS